MIVVTLDMWPHGNESKSYRLGRTFISNKGDGTDTKGNYDVRVMRKGINNPVGLVARQGEVLNYPRLSYNVWRLIVRALLSAFPEEKKI